MTWTPISGAPIQYQKSDGTLASGYYLKFYESGTTTPLSMATDSTGGTTLAKCQINSSGYPINGSSDVFIPHISKDYKIVLYKNSTDADADTTANAEWVVDSNKQTQIGNVVGQRYQTLADLDGDAYLKVGQRVVTLGYTVVGDNGGNLYEIVAAATGTDDGGSYIDLSASGLQAKGLFPGDVCTPEQFGAIGDAEISVHGAATDDTTAVTNAAAFNLPLFVSKIYKITDRIPLEVFAVIKGTSRVRSGFKVESDFNLAAAGVLGAASIYEPGPDLRSFGIFFEQDTTETVRANIIAYPPAIDLASVRAPRLFAKDMRIQAAYDGIDLTGNNGGAHLDSVEISALNKGIITDGALDFMFISNCQEWPFGFSGTALYSSVYSDGQTIFGDFTNIDSFVIENLATFQARVLIDGGFGLISQANLDGSYSRLEITGGAKVGIGTIYSTSSAADDFAIRVDGVETHVVVGSFWLDNATDLTASNGLIQVLTDNTAELVIGQIHAKTSGLNTRLTYMDAGTLVINGGYIEPPQNASLLVDFMDHNGGEMNLSNLRFRDKGTGTGNIISYSVDTRSTLDHITAPGWPISLPSNPVNMKVDGCEFATDLAGNRSLRFQKTFEYSGTLDGSGAALVAHNLTGPQLTLPVINAWYIGGSSERRPLTIDYIDGGNISVSGGTASAGYEIVMMTR